MTMKKKAITAALSILSLGASGAAMAATDGTLGTTSTGTVNVAFTIQPPAGTQIQILGLDDFDFRTLLTSNNSGTTVPSQSGYFCINRSDVGLIFITLSQSGSISGFKPVARESVDSNTDGFFETLPLDVSVIDPNGNSRSLLVGDTARFAQSGASCTAASSSGTAHRLDIAPAPLPSYTTKALTGAYSGTLTLTVAVAS